MEVPLVSPHSANVIRAVPGGMIGKERVPPVSEAARRVLFATQTHEPHTPQPPWVNASVEPSVLYAPAVQNAAAVLPRDALR